MRRRGVEPVPFFLFAKWPRKVQRQYMRHHLWSPRCLCGEYGNPWKHGPELVVLDNWGEHTGGRCQPRAEIIA